LQQVIVNLISNAIDAMDGVHPKPIEITILHEGTSKSGTCRIEVRDHGPGLSEAALAQAFDPFFTTKDPGQGLGLGLSISYNIVRDFDGRLAVANHPEGGAVFSVALRRTPAPVRDSGDMAAE
jgi:two-component system, NtrC family, C4-dicarboxylate transport sensor histidine kinase DctB